MKRYRTIVKSLAFVVALTRAGGAQPAANPILNHADPFITPHPVNGQYLLLATGGSNVTIWSGPTVETVATHARVVFTPTDGLRELWSPTIWHMEGRWWIYFTARMPGKEHAIYVLESDTDEALGNYSFKGALNLEGRAAIDPSVLTVNGVNYLMYVTVDSGANEIHMVRLKTPMQPLGEASLIARPEYAWEKGAGSTRNYPVDEGPTALYHAGKTFLVFSASDTASPRYCLGLMTFMGGRSAPGVELGEVAGSGLPGIIGAWDLGTGPRNVCDRPRRRGLAAICSKVERRAHGAGACCARTEVRMEDGWHARFWRARKGWPDCRSITCRSGSLPGHWRGHTSVEHPLSLLVRPL